jgi:hypothetical protein
MISQISDDLIAKIKKNKLIKESGQQTSIVFPFSRFSEVFPGWERGKYTIITANSGVGKTKMTKFLTITTVYNFIKSNPNLKYKVFYFALEESSDDFWLGIISELLYEKYQIELSPPQLKSLGNFTITDDIFRKVEECKHIIDDMTNYIEVCDHVSNGTGIAKTVKRFFDNPEIGEEIPDPDNKLSKGYKYKDDSLWVFVITDHISLLTQETINGTRLSLHETMGMYSKQYCLKKFCKFYNCVTINVQQQESSKEKQEFYKGETIEEKLEPSLDGLANNKECQRDNQNICILIKNLYFCNMKNTKWDLQKAIQLKEAGLRYSEIAKELGVKDITIQYYFWKNFGKLSFKTNTAKKTEINELTKEVLFGTLLGDANLHLKKNQKNAFGKIEHCLKQLKYLEYKYEFLKSLSNEIKNISRFDKRTEKTYHSVYFTMPSDQTLTEFYNMFYKFGKKTIPEDLSLLTPLAIAIWFMDDGYKSKNGYYLSTNSFSSEDVNRIRKYLFNKYDIESSIDKENKIYIFSKSINCFNKLISEYIIEEMKYKLHNSVSKPG